MRRAPLFILLFFVAVALLYAVDGYPRKLSENISDLAPAAGDEKNPSAPESTPLSPEVRKHLVGRLVGENKQIRYDNRKNRYFLYTLEGDQLAALKKAETYRKEPPIKEEDLQKQLGNLLMHIPAEYQNEIYGH